MERTAEAADRIQGKVVGTRSLVHLLNCYEADKEAAENGSTEALKTMEGRKGRILDRKKLDRARNLKRKSEATKSHTDVIIGLSFDGRKDKTLSEVNCAFCYIFLSFSLAFFHKARFSLGLPSYAKVKAQPFGDSAANLIDCQMVIPMIT